MKTPLVNVNRYRKGAFIEIMNNQVTDLREHVKVLKGICPMPLLMEKIGLGEYTKRLCRSPFREDRKPSFGVFESGGSWFFKDHATGDSGDEIDLLAMHCSLDSRGNFKDLVVMYSGYAGHPIPSLVTSRSKRPKDRSKKVGVTNKQQLNLGTREQLMKMSKARPYPLEAILWAASRGVLRFTRHFGHDCYAITDCTRKQVELRRCDNLPFDAYKDLCERKTHAVKGSNKSWPVGVVESQQFPSIALVEGIPDFIAAHYIVLYEQASHYSKTDVRCAPVAMLGSSGKIDEEALPYFKGKKVRLFVHGDDAGRNSASRLEEQLKSTVSDISYIVFDGLMQANGSPVNDLFDFLNLDFKSVDKKNREEYWRIMP